MVKRVVCVPYTWMDETTLAWANSHQCSLFPKVTEWILPTQGSAYVCYVCPASSDRVHIELEGEE